MAVIKAACPSCGVVRLGALQLSVLVDDERHHSYRFECPRCAGAVVHQITPAIGAVLRSIGVHQEHDAGRPRPTRSAAPLTRDDLVAFRRQLERDDCLERFIASAPPESDSRS